jgi:uncharacterized membrane protein YecN with MAPEG domain
MTVAFHLTVIVTALALLINILFAMRVGQARGRLGVDAPATTGPEEFNCLYRIQQNTIEQSVLFLPSLWLFHAVFHTIWGAVIGVIWIVGRLVYARAYMRDPKKRGPGMILTFASSLVLLLSALAGSLVGIF